MINALSIDLEFWHTAELVRKYAPAQKEDHVLEAIDPLLELLAKYNVEATFFVLGILAEKYPEVVKKIYEGGHEIASHGYSHKTLYDLDISSFDDEIEKSVNILRSITGENPLGFRAPTFSINNSTKWAFEILEKHGFEYDSSIFPIKTMLYGEPTAPLYIYRPSKNDVTKNDPYGNIIEFPMTVGKLWNNIPLSGGFYFRLLPYHLLNGWIKKINRERPAIIYLHPWETCPKTPRLDLPTLSKFITYHKIDSTLNKFERLLKDFEFTSVKNVLHREELTFKDAGT